MLIKRYGTGPDVYFCLHGWSGDHSTFEPLLPFMPADASLYSADLPGYGSSGRPQDWELANINREITEALRQFNGQRVTLVGNCIGALLAASAAAADPELVRRLVLIDPLAWWPWYFRIFTLPLTGRIAYWITFANPVGRWITNIGLAGRRSAETNLTDGFASVQHGANLGYLRAMREIVSPEQFAGIPIPIDVVFGSRTFRAIRESARRWRRVWPQALVHELPDAGHLPLREAPAAMSDIIFKGGACSRDLQLTSAATRR